MYGKPASQEFSIADDTDRSEEVEEEDDIPRGIIVAVILFWHLNSDQQFCVI